MSISTYPPRVNGLTLPLAVNQGGTGGDDAAEARTNLGLGTMAQQNASAVAITGGSAQFGGKATPYWLAAPNAQIDYFYGAMSIEGAVIVGSTLETNGNIGIKTAPHINVGLNIVYDSAASQNGIHLRSQSAGAASAVIFVRADAASYVGSISTTDTATAYNTSSDARLKHAVEKLVGSLDSINALHPVSFLWNADNSEGHGFLAHELQQIIPAAITGEPNELNNDGSIKPQQVDHSKLVPWLVGAIQELSAQVQTLTARLEEALA